MQTEYPGTAEGLQNVQPAWNGITRRREKGTDEIFDAMMTVSFPQINVRHPTIDPGRSERARSRTDVRKLCLGIWFSNCEIKGKKPLEEAHERDLTSQRSKEENYNLSETKQWEWSEIFKVSRGRNPPTENSLLCQIIPQKPRRNKDFLGQTKITASIYCLGRHR